MLEDVLDGIGFGGLWRSSTFHIANDQARQCTALTDRLIEVSRPVMLARSWDWTNCSVAYHRIEKTRGGWWMGKGEGTNNMEFEEAPLAVWLRMMNRNRFYMDEEKIPLGGRFLVRRSSIGNKIYEQKLDSNHLHIQPTMQAKIT